METRAQCKEHLDTKAKEAFQSFLSDIVDEHHDLFRDVVNKLAISDCLQSLAAVAGNLDYVRPQFTDLEDTITIKQGRHPMVEALSLDPFIPNDIQLGIDDGSCKIITGPNMGGKSSATRMVAIIALMAQVGSFVPAESVRLSMLDSIMTRMGGTFFGSLTGSVVTDIHFLASDELMRGRSTFMVEMMETSEILHGSTSKSLVILDELGRGTSTFDGVSPLHIIESLLMHCVPRWQ